jgi:hypothetical protein
MKLSNRQQLDLDTVMYYYTSHVVPTEDDIESYFAWSDRGKKAFITRDTPGAERLRTGKTYRDLQVTSYIEDWGKYITATDLAEEPEFICRWLAKVMNKPGIYTAWKLFNAPDQLDAADHERLEPLAQIARASRESV